MHKIIDNFLPQEDFEKIKSIIMGGDFPWYFINSISSPRDVENFYFSHAFFNNHQMSCYFNILYPLINKLNIKAIIRAKGNLYTKTDNLIVHDKHRDNDYEHNGALFYFNTNNGFTILEDGSKIESVENRILLFNPQQLHSSTSCTDEKIRVNVIFNYF